MSRLKNHQNPHIPAGGTRTCRCQDTGCRQENQGQGVGSALLKQGIRHVDEQGMPAYLESSEARNVTLYERHGFEVVAEEVLPGAGPRVWFMWREAR